MEGNVHAISWWNIFCERLKHVSRINDEVKKGHMKQQNSEKNLLRKFRHLLALMFGSSSVDSSKNSV